MELTVNKAGKYALVWLTNAEKADPKVMDSLQPLIEQCKTRRRSTDWLFLNQVSRICWKRQQIC